MNSASLTLRKFSPADAPEVWLLISNILRSYGFAPNRETTERDLADIGATYGGERGAFFVLLDGERIVGTVAYRFTSPGDAELCRMYLAGEYRGRGTGRRLLDHISTAARASGARRLHLKTASVLHAAISLYKKAGFALEPDGCCEGNCDVAMAKPLSDTPVTGAPECKFPPSLTAWTLW